MTIDELLGPAIQTSEYLKAGALILVVGGTLYALNKATDYFVNKNKEKKAKQEKFDSYENLVHLDEKTKGILFDKMFIPVEADAKKYECDKENAGLVLHRAIGDSYFLEINKNRDLVKINKDYEVVYSDSFNRDQARAQVDLESH